MTDQQPSDRPFSEREVKLAVTERYGARARAALEQAGFEAPATGAAADACCAPAAETAGPQPLQLIEVDGGTVCGPDGCEIDSAEDVKALDNLGRSATVFYSGGELNEVPEAAQLAAAGCGNPVAIAELAPGEAVLDLGSGGGIDCFLAAQQVGEQGEVWGLDMTPDMVQLARKNGEQVRATNVRFRLGEIEDIPFAERHFDAVISNCVINLSPDKPQVFREAFRVLKPGGRLRVSDIVFTKDLPPERMGDLSEWAGCIAGALPVEEYLGAIRDAGFVEVSADYSSNHEDGDRAELGIVSAYVSARRPQ